MAFNLWRRGRVEMCVSHLGTVTEHSRTKSGSVAGPQRDGKPATSTMSFVIACSRNARRV